MRLRHLILIPLVLAVSWPAAAAAAAGDRQQAFFGRDTKLELAGTETESESDAPRICLNFSEDLQERGEVRYEDYVRFDPEISAAFSARGKQLCVEGVEHGKIYGVTVLKGLPGAGERATETTERFDVAVPDRAPSLGFRGAAYILPREGRRELPLDSVNIDKARLEVLRINDRNLIQEINQGNIGTILGNSQTRLVETLSGELVWRGTMDIESRANRRTTTAIPIGRVFEDPEPGIYVVVARQADERASGEYQATQWVVVSNIGISSYLGAHGLHVFLRSLDGAKPLGGVEARLVARNNTELARAVSGSDGLASFAPGLVRGSGGARPGAVMVFGEGGDFNFLDLTRPAFDLGDRGVGGREAPGPIDAYLYTERGVYRPGATVHLVTLLRDDTAAAVPDLPVVLKVFRPDGTEHRRFTFDGDGREGGRHLALPLSASARTGQWTVRAYVDPDAAPVGSVGFQVEDFVPERMEVELTPAAERLEPGVDSTVELAARFLYGAPAADLRVESEIVLRQDMNPYPMHRGFKFGLVQEEWRAKRAVLEPLKTDSEGRARLAVRLDGAPETTRPLRAVVRASVAETGGRAVSRSVSLPVRTRPFAIGIKPRFGEGAVENGQEAGFEVIAVDHDGATRPAGGLTYELIEEEYRYHWYYSRLRWNYKVLIHEEPLESGRLSLAADAPATLAFKRGWGRYRLEVRDPATGVATSVRFRVGWFTAPQAADVPDKLDITLDKDSYKAGETAKVHVRPPFAGEVLLTVAGTRLNATRLVEVPKGGATIALEVEDNWEAGVYVTATAFRPVAGGGKRGPTRAIGVAWLGRDFSDRTLAVEIDGPEKVVPRQTVAFDVKVNGVAPGQPAFVTLAAVDEGILQLTEFASPAPEDHYFGKRRLAVELRDNYGHLIESAEGRQGRLRQGGDADAAGRHLGGLDASSVKTVALFSGLVRLDGNGRARIPLEIPDFNGRLRLMAVAYDRTRVGHGESRIVVRDAVVSQVTLPRFLAPRDEGRVTVSLHNLDGSPGKYRLALSANGVVAVTDRAEETVLDLGRDERGEATFTLKGMRVGTAEIAMTIEGPAGFAVVRGWDLAVRPAQTVVTRHLAERLAPGDSETFDDALLADFVPGTGEVLLSLSGQPDFDVAGLLRSLDRYPYGCAEQTTSRALPLLYVSDVAEAVGLAEDGAAIRKKVQKAIHRVLSMQRSDGSFGMWSSQDNREAWLTAYVLDFLAQADAKGYLVPDFAYTRGLNWLAGSVRGSDFGKWQLPASAYAFYVLARAERARLGDLRYFHDVYLGQIPTALGRAQVGAALALYGDRERAEQAFAKARRVDRRGRSFFGDYWRYSDYGTRLRDASGIVYLASTADAGAEHLPNLMELVNDLRERDRYTSTQEKAWLLLLASQRLQDGAPVQVALDGETLGPRRKPLYLRPAAETLAAELKVENRGEKHLWWSATVSGVPARDQSAERNGFVVKRAFYTLEGKRADLDELRQGDVLVAVIRGEATTELDHQALIVDLLPAGFEIENARLAGARDNEDLGWLPELTAARHTELRDDRFAAAVDLDDYKGDFTFAYMVRAVTPGTFRVPAVYVEDMYKPTYFARHRMDRVKILPQE
jgi:uncharacterized protein YfaS (alpha-2-macroglobulin family)